MNNVRTAGQANYEAHRDAVPEGPLESKQAFDKLPPHIQLAWERGADAVQTYYQGRTNAFDTDPRFRQGHRLAPADVNDADINAAPIETPAVTYDQDPAKTRSEKIADANPDAAVPTVLQRQTKVHSDSDSVRGTGAGKGKGRS